MKNKFQLNTGNAFILGAGLMIITMLSHPHADSLEELIKPPSIVIKINMFTHSIAILSSVFVLYGCWGFTTFLKCNISRFAMIFICVGSIMVDCAATFDGFVLSSFIQHIKNQNAISNQVSDIVLLNGVIVESFSLIYVFSVCIAVILYSVAIVSSAKLPKWIGFYGVFFSCSAMIAIFFGANLVDFIGIKIFVFGFVSWILIIGGLLKRLNTTIEAS